MRVSAATLLALVLLGLVTLPFTQDDDRETESVAAVSTTERRTTTSDAPTTERITTTTERVTTTTRPSGPETLPVGQTLEMVVTDYDGAETYVDVTVANPATFTEEPVDYGMTPQNGLYLVLDVSVAARPESEGVYPVTEWDFKFVAADGSVAETTFVSGFEPMLPSTELSAGQQVSGKIVFDINPAQQPGARIQINDIGDDYGQPFAYWALA